MNQITATVPVPTLCFPQPEGRSHIEDAVDRYSGQALAVARTLLRDEHAAEDAVQEAFVRAVRRREQYSVDRPFAPWFFSILRNICLDELRRRKVRTAAHALLSLFSDQLEETPAPAVSLGILDQLESPERDVLHYRIVCDMSFEEVAAAVGCSVEAAKKRAQRGLARLRTRVRAG